LSKCDIQEANLQGVDLSEAILPALAQVPLLGTFIADRWHELVWVIARVLACPASSGYKTKRHLSHICCMALFLSCVETLGRHAQVSDLASPLHGCTPAILAGTIDVPDQSDAAICRAFVHWSMQSLNDPALRQRHVDGEAAPIRRTFHRVMAARCMVSAWSTLGII
jgi:hypothetical protein